MKCQQSTMSFFGMRPTYNTNTILVVSGSHERCDIQRTEGEHGTVRTSFIHIDAGGHLHFGFS
jgi:hypothetical protein